MRALLAVAAIALTACTTIEQREASEQERFASFVGQSVDTFIRQTTIAPTSYYPTSTGRVFVAATGTCNLLIDATPTSRTVGADSWLITRVTYRGGCANI